MEVLVVLTIFALGTAVVMPSMSKMLDQTMSHAVFFEFQRQVSDLRREASRSGLPVQVVDSDQEMPVETSGEEVRQLKLQTDWTYSLSPSLMIEAGGRCAKTRARLMNRDQVVMRLETEDGDCKFIRYHLED